MKQYTYVAVVFLYINLLIRILYALEEFDLINFVSDPYAYLLPITFFFTFLLWNGLLVTDKKNKST